MFALKSGFFFVYKHMLFHAFNLNKLSSAFLIVNFFLLCSIIYWFSVCLSVQIFLKKISKSFGGKIVLKKTFPAKSLFDMRSAVQLMAIFPPKNLENNTAYLIRMRQFLKKNFKFFLWLHYYIFTCTQTTNTVSHILLLLIQSDYQLLLNVIKSDYCKTLFVLFLRANAKFRC